MMKSDVLNNGALSIEELKALFKANDYTTTVSRYDPQTASNEQNTVYLKAKKHFKLAWLGQMKGFGGKSSFRNFSNDYPVKVLETADENLVAGTVMEILADETLTDAIFDSVLSSMEQPITEAIESYALSAGKKSDELCEDEIVAAVDRFADAFLSKMMNLMMQSQSVPEILGATKEVRTHEDFNNSLPNNYSKIDFDRAWTHSRTRVGAMLSLEGLDEIETVESAETIAISNILVENFLSTLDSTDQEIVRMLRSKCKQKEITQALGYKTHSAVTKRIDGIRKKCDAFFENKS